MRVFCATAYDKCMKDLSYETYITEWDGDYTEDDNKINELLAPYGITTDDVHYYFGDGELDDRAYMDTAEFFYLIGEEINND